jgi:hypothetical protein
MTKVRLTTLVIASAMLLPVAGRADTQTTHRVHKIKKDVPPPLPSGTQGPVPQVPLDAIPAVAPQVSFEDGLLTIVAPNSTLGDILRGVRKHTSADIEVPATASERVVTRLGPGPAREVMAELLNGSRFNYILLGSPQDANALVRVVLVAKTSEATAGAQAPGAAEANVNAPPPVELTNAVGDAQDADAVDDSNTDENAEQAAAEAEQLQQQQQNIPPDQGVRTPQQMLQEMQQRQLMMQQQGTQQPGMYPPPPGLPIPQRPQTQPDQP